MTTNPFTLTSADLAPLSWHQSAALRRDYRLRNKPAHIRRPDWISTGKMLCGATSAPVTIDAKHRNNPANKPCAHCKRIADKLSL